MHDKIRKSISIRYKQKIDFWSITIFSIVVIALLETFFFNKYEDPWAIITSVSTFIGLFIALAGRTLLEYFFRPKIRVDRNQLLFDQSTANFVVTENINGNLQYRFEKTQTPFYFINILLRTVNRKYKARSVKVNLLNIYRYDKNSEFVSNKIIPAESLFIFTPAEKQKTESDISSVKSIDIVRFWEDGRIELPLDIKYNNYDYRINPGEPVRLHIEVIGDNLIDVLEFYLEIFWNGKWSSDITEMKENIKYNIYDDLNADLNHIEPLISEYNEIVSSKENDTDQQSIDDANNEKDISSSAYITDNSITDSSMYCATTISASAHVNPTILDIDNVKTPWYWGSNYIGLIKPYEDINDSKEDLDTGKSRRDDTHKNEDD